MKNIILLGAVLLVLANIGYAAGTLGDSTSISVEPLEWDSGFAPIGEMIEASTERWGYSFERVVDKDLNEIAIPDPVGY